MSGGRKRILSPFTRRKKRKAWKTRENYMADETDTGSYYNQEEWLEEFLDDKGAFDDGTECDDSENDDENCTENIEAVVWRCSSKLVFLKISQISQENTCVGVSF